MNRFAKLFLIVVLAVTAFSFIGLDNAQAGCYYHGGYYGATYFAPSCYYGPTYNYAPYCNYGNYGYGYGAGYGYGHYGW